MSKKLVETLTQITWTRSTAAWCMWDVFQHDDSILREHGCSRQLSLAQVSDVVASLYTPNGQARAGNYAITCTVEETTASY